MSAQPLLSVIVANRDNERYVAQCLESALAQSWSGLEIVVYDDASGDDSPAIVERFARRLPGRVRLLRGTVRRGVAAARHQAILAARGEYLTTLDSDDYYANPRKLENELALVRACAAQEGREVLAFSNVLLAREGATPIPWGKPETIAQGMIGARILARSCFIPRDFTFRRELYFQAGGYDHSLEIYEDWDLKIRLALKHEFRYTGDVGSAYRRHGGGLSARPFSEHLPVLRAVLEKNLSLFPSGEHEGIRRGLEDWIAAVALKRKQNAIP